MSTKYRQLSRGFDPYKLHPAEADEIRIFMSTPGLLHVHVRHMMQWDHNALTAARMLLSVKEADPELCHANAASVTLADGCAMLRALLDGHREFAHAPPLYVTRYLQAQRSRGAKAKDLAKFFGTTPDRIKRWWSADIFDPLSGRPRPRHLLRRNKPITTSTRKIGVVI